MAKRMLIDSTHPEETRVAVISGNRLEEFDFESARKKQIKGNVYLAKVTRVEPSLQACFVEYGGNRHGFLAFNEIHPDYYRIPVADREALNRMVAEAMAAQEDEDEEQPQERRPRWRRRGRRRGGRGGEADEQQASNNGEPAGDQPSGEPPLEGDSGEPDLPPAFDDGRREDAVALDMERPERVAGEPSDLPGRDDLTGEPGTPPPAEFGDDVTEVTAGPDVPPAESEERPFPEAIGTADTRADESPAAAEAAPFGESEPSDAEGPLPAGDARESLGEAAAEPRVTEESVETVGGDEVDDIRRRHRIWQRRYKIQEVIRKRQILLVQVAKEERGNKGAALTTYISLAGRYCVLMPNTPRGGGISRKITSQQDRRRLKEIVGELEVPDGMAVIVRTAGMERSKPELRRDLDFLLKTWDGIREKALDSTAPALIYEEANLIKRAVRDLYTKEVEEIIVDGAEGHEAARSFMKLLMPNHVSKVIEYSDKQIPLFHRYQVESQIDSMHSASVQLRSGGYIVLNPTEALVAIDVNSGRSTRERNIEETATRTNLEAADEVARQLRLRDLAGLIVIDFIDMEEGRNRHAVERRLKEALRHDRARIQVGRISPFGLLEMSRQRLRPSLVEASMMQCPHCMGAGYVRSTESMALSVLRAVEEEGLRQRCAEVTVGVPKEVALYIFNNKRAALGEIEARHDFRVVFQPDETMGLSTYRILRSVPKSAESRPERAPTPSESGEGRSEGRGEGRGESPPADHRVERLSEEPDAGEALDVSSRGSALAAGEAEAAPAEDAEAEAGPAEGERAEGARTESEGGPRDAGGERRGRRRGRRGGRRRRGRQRDGEAAPGEDQPPPRESTLGPFGEEQGAATEAAPAGQADEEPPRGSDRDGDGESAGRRHAPEPERAPEPPAAPEREPAPEPRAAEERAAAPPPAPERVAAEPPPPAPEPPPAAPAAPAAPARRGWWNLRRG
ncbi:MAG: Rne/Rng family ribonuclease [Candidatus Odyssella sp.]|nr:Rne/Rng family ribonuclease [Candidatus Odyssella sp.]